MKLSQFKFRLPEQLIAQYPLAERDASRMLVLHRRSGRREHRMFKDILNYFGDKDLLIFNDTSVFPAAMTGTKEKTNAKIAVFLLRELNEESRLWDVLVDPARKIRVGNKLYFGDSDSMVAEVIDNTTSRGRTVRFLYDGDHESFKRDLFLMGKTPLPYYIDRKPEPEDAERYQTVFAAKEGAVVAPAAGLHFSTEMMKRLELSGVDKDFITLHCSLSMFRDIDVEDLTKHKMESEQMEVGEHVVKIFNERMAMGKQICAVGTSTLRALETASTANGKIKPFEGWTNRFIFPPYQFTTLNSLLTNFHMPYSTMLMSVAAFAGYDLVMKTYEIAVKEGYRFGAYGDAMLILDD